ncbi:Predicted hydrolase of the alpha/beta superfamily [Dendrosporobacter quercicolus]|uniref:Predicted hydrolase of the alpha/beta superfamily n=1 Tax=Dendrosporobacter quercicolus TaxID=146817 RepID=A0A1G9Y222_9FIRM|nr:Predicted hydrolase of the alpha/beta superfamily [Dendrosporobacter quercicolus]
MNGLLRYITVMGRDLSVYLPPEYAYGQDRFPVVYVQDGGDLFLHQISSLEELFSRCVIRRLIFVGIKPGRRNDEYTPWPSPALSGRFAPFGGQGRGYLDFLANQLKPYIDDTCRTLASPENTAIIGASLGGLISMYAAYLYPDIFGGIGSISGSFWYEGFMDFMRTAALANAQQKIYLDVGTLEGAGKTNLQAAMLEKTRQAYDILLQKGVSPDHCRLALQAGAAHGPDFFLQPGRFQAALQWLFPGAAVNE